MCNDSLHLNNIHSVIQECIDSLCNGSYGAVVVVAVVVEIAGVELPKERGSSSWRKKMSILFS